MKKLFDPIKSCRVCQSVALIIVHDFGEVPLADKLTDTPEQFVPFAKLSVLVCADCSHLQISENVSPVVLFQDDYPYFSSRIPEVVKHFKEYYTSITSQYAIGSNDMVVEIASNDGVLLNHFRSNTSLVLGIEPSLAPAKAALENGIPTFTKFFSKKLALEIVKKQKVYPKLIMANNVLAHVPEPIDFVQGLKLISNEETIILVEVPHSLPMIKAGTFDVIFHQHYSYFNLKGLKFLFEREGLYINKVEKVDTQGGSLRLHIQQVQNNLDDSLNLALDEEEAFGLYSLETYKKFSDRIESLKIELCGLLAELKASNKKIVGYGAPGKSATLLNYFDIDKDKLDYLVDVSSSKHQKYFPFTSLKIYDLKELDINTPDYILILAWNYTGEILNNLAYLKDKNVQFITMYPEVKFIV